VTLIKYFNQSDIILDSNREAHALAQ